MNPNDPQTPNPFNNVNDPNGVVSPDPMQGQNSMPQNPAPSTDWSQPASSNVPDWQRNIMPTPGQPAPQPQGQMPQQPTQVMGGDMGSNLPPAQAMPPQMSAQMPGVMPSAIPGQAPGMPGMNAPMMPPSDTSGRRKIVMIIVLFVALVVIVGAGFYIAHLVQKNHDKNSTNNAAQHSTSSTSAPNINTLSSFSFVQPSTAKLNGMTVSSGSTSGETVLTGAADPSTGVSCNIFYGIFSQTDLPGTDIGDVVSRATAQLRSEGVSISGPNDVKALVLKNSATSATYSLPTVNFSYTKSDTSEVATYSISQLKDGTHAAVLEACGGKDTVANLTTKVNALAPIAGAIEVKTQ